MLASLALIVGSWFVYDLFWISSFAEKHKSLATGISLLSVGALSFGLCHIFTGRGAFLHLGAIFATLMVLNVWIRILPGQRKMFEAAKAGKVPDYTSGTKAKWRSTHNSYMTLPVLFSMISNHFPLVYGHGLNWVLLILIAVLGGVVRHMMIQWNVGKSGAKFLIPIVLLVVLLVFLSTGNGKFWVGKIPGPPVPFSEVKAVIDLRCLSCHSQHPTEKMFLAPPNGIVFEDPATIQRLASRIHERVWVTKTMPFINKTGMTDDERALVGRWVEGGAKLE